MAQIDNLTLEAGDTGVVLKFTARNGTSAALDMEQLAARCEGDIREVLLAWCQDRRTHDKPQTLAEQPNPLLVQDYAD
jgi:hypothetical protein